MEKWKHVHLARLYANLILGRTKDVVFVGIHQSGMSEKEIKCKAYEVSLLLGCISTGANGKKAQGIQLAAFGLLMFSLWGLRSCLCCLLRQPILELPCV
jgi:hypothetical protein